jgi:uncharacterized membrane protein YfcA
LLLSKKGTVDPGIVVAGLFIGTLIGLTGMGGGSLTTPFLILFAGVRPVLAVGTDLIYSAATKWLGAAVHLRQRTVDLRLAAMLGLGSVPASLIGVRVVNGLGGSADEVVAKGLGAALILVAGVLLLRRPIERALKRRTVTRSGWPGASDPSSSLRPRVGALATVGLGAAVGFLVGFTSVGSGTLIVAALLLLYPALPLGKVVGTDVMQAALLTSVAGVAYLGLGQVDLSLAAALLAGSLPGVVIGSRLSAKAPEHVLQPVLAGVLMLAGARLL